MDVTESQLAHRPNVAEGHKKLLRLRDGTTVWQLRVGGFRVLYDVDANAAEVTVRRVLEKGRLTSVEMMNR
jgi:mRNA-degrading endonuclease RelE of RelBE toxin-antitoxin system